MPIKDPKKNREYQRKWYKNNKETQHARIAARKKIIKDWFQEYRKTLKCELCGENHPATLDFHHNDPKQKERTLSYLVCNGYSQKTLLAEMTKCTVLCSNCHRKHHYDE